MISEMITNGMRVRQYIACVVRLAFRTQSQRFINIMKMTVDCCVCVRRFCTIQIFACRNWLRLRGWSLLLCFLSVSHVLHMRVFCFRKFWSWIKWNKYYIELWLTANFSTTTGWTEGRNRSPNEHSTTGCDRSEVTWLIIHRTTSIFFSRHWEWQNWIQLSSCQFTWCALRFYSWAEIARQIRHSHLLFFFMTSRLNFAPNKMSNVARSYSLMKQNNKLA